jgi:molecular chaperone GrpE (heat shock protein)
MEDFMKFGKKEQDAMSLVLKRIAETANYIADNFGREQAIIENEHKRIEKEIKRYESRQNKRIV